MIHPVKPGSTTRSFVFKLRKYKVFLQTFRKHPLIRRMETLLGKPFPGFRVLVVTTRGELNKSNLLHAAKDYKKLVYLAKLAEIKAGNLFTDPLWSLPNGEHRGLLD